MQAQVGGPAPNLADGSEVCGEPSSNTLPLSDALLHALSALRSTEPRGSQPAPETPKEHVRLNMEVLSDQYMKALFAGLYLSVALSSSALLVLVTAKYKPSFLIFERHKAVLLANAVVALIMLFALVIMLGVFFHRIKKAMDSGLVWTARRKRMVWLQCSELIVQTLSSVFYLLPNVYGLTRDCALFRHPVHYFSFLRLSMWNIVFLLFVVKARMFNLWNSPGTPNQEKRSDCILLDAPLRHHWRLGLYWILFELASMFTLLQISDHGFDDSCEEQDKTCISSNQVVAGFWSVIILAIGYQLLITFFLLKSSRQLKQKSYTDFRWTNVVVKYHFRSMGLVGDFVIFSVIPLWAIRYQSCDSYLLSWFGLLPVETAMSFQAIVNSIFWLPLKPKQHQHQRFENIDLCWTESQAIARNEKAFQFELAVKLYYWCELIYNYEVGIDECRAPFRLTLGKELFGLANHVFLREEEVETNVIIAWNQRTIVVCFRGTSNLKNFREDMRIWRNFHPPKRGNYFRGTQPLVHIGFHKSWTTCSLNHRVLNKIIQIMHSAEFDSRQTRVLVTGHSLGGALAVLASYDIVRYCGLAPTRISCYTFGAPRVGNHAFAHDYNQKVPDTWQIINDCDVVTRSPKLVFIYKHVGEKVIINRAGDIILSPLFVEINLHRAVRYQWRTRPLAQHPLSSYRKSLVAIVKAQFIKNKGLPGGMEAMMKLLQEGHRHIVDILNVTRHSTLVIAERGSHYWNFTRTTNRKKRIGRLQRAGMRFARYFSCLECFGAVKHAISSQERADSMDIDQLPNSFQASSIISTGT